MQSVLGGLLWLLAASLETGNSLAFAQKSAGSAYEATNRARGLFENLVSFELLLGDVDLFLFNPKLAFRVAKCFSP